MTTWPAAYDHRDIEALTDSLFKVNTHKLIVTSWHTGQQGLTNFMVLLIILTNFMVLLVDLLSVTAFLLSLWQLSWWLNKNAVTLRRLIPDQYQFRSKLQDLFFQYHRTFVGDRSPQCDRGLTGTTLYHFEGYNTILFNIWSVHNIY